MAALFKSFSKSSMLKSIDVFRDLIHINPATLSLSRLDYLCHWTCTNNRFRSRTHHELQNDIFGRKFGFNSPCKGKSFLISGFQAAYYLKKMFTLRKWLRNFWNQTMTNKFWMTFKPLQKHFSKRFIQVWDMAEQA